MPETLIIIPARMGSKRFPGKPLAEIAGKSMLRRTFDVATQAGNMALVATDHDDIAAHCEAYNIPYVMTASDLNSGTDRCWAAAQEISSDADIIVNLQGDAPFTDPSHIRNVINALMTTDADMATPYVQLDWVNLDGLRAAKADTPFSGTTLVTDTDEMAVWFSKNIIPAIRKEDALRAASPLSPVKRHIGLYAYRRAALEQFVAASEAPYEALEGLEQLRALHIGLRIKAVQVASPAVNLPGIDTPADLARAEAALKALEG